MIPIEFNLDIFSEHWGRKGSEAVLDILLEALTQADLIYLRNNPRTPLLYQSGIRYYHDSSKEEWLSIPEAMRQGIADCKSLSTWLAAEYRVTGVDKGAKCTKRFAVIPGPAGVDLLLYHILVLRSDGSIEDPSKQLGMNVDEPDGYQPVPGIPWTVAHGMTNIVGAAINGNPKALGQLDELRRRAEAGDARCKYLVEIARLIKDHGYDPSRTEWARLPDGTYGWTRPGETNDPRERT